MTTRDSRPSVAWTVLLAVTCLTVVPVIHAAAAPASGEKRIQTCTELFADGSTHPTSNKGVGAVACLWQKRTLVVRFLEGESDVQDRVRRIAQEWTQYSGITFVFDSSAANADIRVAFGPTGHWSYVGSCQKPELGQQDPTLNLELTRFSPESEYRRVVLHEFGHALGLQHEHQNPGANIQWDEEAVYAYYARTQGWDRPKIKSNVLDRLRESETNHGAYDPNSIMEYPIPRELTRNGFEVGWNTELSPEDKRFMRELYRGGRTSDATTLPAAANVASESMGAAAGLRAGLPLVQSAPTLRQLPSLALPAPTRPAAASALPSASVMPAADQSIGKLEDYINNNGSYRKLQLVRANPRIDALEPKLRDKLLKEYDRLVTGTGPSHDSLRSATAALDREVLTLDARNEKFESYLKTYTSDLTGYEERRGAYDTALANYERDLAQYGTAVSTHNPKVASYESRVASHNAQVAAYNQQCLGRQLPRGGPYEHCVSFYQTISQQKNLLDGEKAQLDQSKAALDRRLDQLESRRRALDGRVTQLNTDRAELEKTRGILLAEQKSLTDLRATIEPRFNEAIRQIDAWRADVDKLHDQLQKALGDLPTTMTAQTWSGNWQEGEKRSAEQNLNGLKDEVLRAWVAAHAEFHRGSRPTSSPGSTSDMIASAGSALNFYDGFFTSGNHTKRENLLALEAGKVLYDAVKNDAFGQWFAGYYAAHTSTIAQMRDAKHHAANDSHPAENASGLGDLVDAHSAFGFVFRAEALKLSPSDPAVKKDWEEVTGNFRRRFQALQPSP